jgi:hypothetical protein
MIITPKGRLQELRNICNVILESQQYSVVYCGIQAAIDDAVTGDTIYVAAGDYTPAAGRIFINKSLTLAAHPSLGISGPHPQNRPVIQTNSTTWTGCGVQIAANDVILDGFEIENSSAGTRVFYIVGDWNSPCDGWTVRNCDIHDGRNGIRIMGDMVTIEHNNIHQTHSDLINCEYGTCYGLVVRHNWLHSHYPADGGKPAGITYNCSETSPGSWADVTISYNYCWASRTFVDFQNNGGLSPANVILVNHNTVDWWIGDLPDPLQASDQAQLMSIAWWSDTGNWNAANFDIRDNLFTRQKWYNIVDTDLLLSGVVSVRNCLFHMWYLLDDYYPAYAYPNEWPGPRGAVGWDDMGSGNEFVMIDCIHGQDPLYTFSGTYPDDYYALSGPESPAYQAATDNTNIGAWQGLFQITPTPTTTPEPTATPSPTHTGIPTNTPIPTATPTPLPIPATSPAGVIFIMVIITILLIALPARTCLK